MRKHTPLLALFVLYVAVTLTWQYKMTLALQRLEQESVQRDQMNAWIEHMALENGSLREWPRF